MEKNRMGRGGCGGGGVIQIVGAANVHAMIVIQYSLLFHSISCHPIFGRRQAIHYFWLMERRFFSNYLLTNSLGVVTQLEM